MNKRGWNTEGITGVGADDALQALLHEAAGCSNDKDIISEVIERRAGDAVDEAVSYEDVQGLGHRHELKVLLSNNYRTRILFRRI